MPEYYWKIDDGRVWAAAETRFLAEAEIPATGVDNLGGGVEALRSRINFYELPLGELATRLDLIKAVQEKYQPALEKLNSAWLSAQIDGDEETMAEIAGEKRELRAAMANEIKAIQEGK